MNSGSCRWRRKYLYVHVSFHLFYHLTLTYPIPDAPRRLKKEVDAVLTLQDDVAAVEKVIDEARNTLSHTDGGVASGTRTSIQDLRRHQQQLLASVDRLYTSLNVHDRFPELKGVDVEFVRTLLLARDLKINIRKRAVGSFLEWERLDQAVGGKHQALGKLQIYYICWQHPDT